MPVHEVNLVGLFASPILVYVLIAIAATTVIGWIVDKLIPFSLQRNESLMTLLTFVVVLALCMRAGF